MATLLVSGARQPAPQPWPAQADGAWGRPATKGEHLPLMLLPGTLCDGRLFAPMLGYLRGQTVLIGDMTRSSSADELADRLLAQAPPHFALAGFSLGGIVALEIVARAPERVSRLALMDTTARPDPVDNALRRRTALAKARSTGIDSFVLDAWPQLVAPLNRGRADLRDLLVGMARDGGPDVLATQTEVAISRVDSRPRLHAIRVPTLVLAGRHEAVCPLEAHREIADAVPGSAFHIIPGAGHFAPLENPEAVAARLRGWLAIGSDRRKVTP